MIASTVYSLALYRGHEMIFLLENFQDSIRIMLKIARIQCKASGCSVLSKEDTQAQSASRREEEEQNTQGEKTGKGHFPLGYPQQTLHFQFSVFFYVICLMSVSPFQSDKLKSSMGVSQSLCKA